LRKIEGNCKPHEGNDAIAFVTNSRYLKEVPLFYRQIFPLHQRAATQLLRISQSASFNLTEMKQPEKRDQSCWMVHNNSTI